MNRVQLNQAEFTWLVNNVRRNLTVMDAVAQRDPDIIGRSRYKALKAVSEIKETPSEDGTLVDIQLTDKQKKVLREMIKNTAIALEHQILPEYQRRGGMESYIADVEQKLILLSGLGKRLK